MQNLSVRTDVRKILLSKMAEQATKGFHGLPRTLLFGGLGMKPGPYQLESRLWSSLDSNLSPHILRSKGQRDEGGERPRRYQPRWLGQRCGPTTAFVGRQEVLLFRPGHSVERLWATQRISHEFLADVEVLTSEMAGPRLAARCSGRSLVSEWVEGVAISDMNPTDRILAIRQILLAITRISQRTARPDHDRFVEQIIALGLNGPAAAAFSYIAADPRLPALMNTPLTLQHGEPAGANLLVQTDGSPVVIDWDPGTIGWRPFWADAAHLASVDDYGPLMAGELDHDLARLWQSVGLEPAAPIELRAIVALGSALFFAMIGLTATMGGQIIRLSDPRAPVRISKSRKVVAAVERLRRISVE